MLDVPYWDKKKNYFLFFFFAFQISVIIKLGVYMCFLGNFSWRLTHIHHVLESLNLTSTDDLKFTAIFTYSLLHETENDSIFICLLCDALCCSLKICQHLLCTSYITAADRTIQHPRLCFHISTGWCWSQNSRKDWWVSTNWQATETGKGEFCSIGIHGGCHTVCVILQLIMASF